MRRAEPDDSEEWLAGGSRAVDEADGFGDEDLGAFALEYFGVGTIARQGGVELEEVVVGEPFMKAHGTGADG